ncbi:hypothetical protein C0Q70_08385 [Pomacea canaliculata]|uniref:Uncharacterized protein n=1 Tax=Pomacea canaliculata TaxID=400727 RepID=A0A2T7PHP0_POMCA|nr:hypothetical protein C0Q70_08385 [Pomacea canaliculata]
MSRACPPLVSALSGILLTPDVRCPRWQSRVRTKTQQCGDSHQQEAIASCPVHFRDMPRVDTIIISHPEVQSPITSCRPLRNIVCSVVKKRLRRIEEQSGLKGTVVRVGDYSSVE